MNHPLLIALLSGVAGMSSCVNSKPVSTSLPPGPNSVISVTVTERKPASLGYANARVQAGMSQGAAGAMLIAVMHGGEMTKTWAYSKKWIAAGGDSRRIAREEYTRALQKAGYVVRDSAPNSVTIGLTTPGITSTTQKGLFKAMAGPWVNAQLPDGRHGYDTFVARAFSDTAFSLEGLSHDVFDKALREAYRKSAELVIHGQSAR